MKIESRAKSVLARQRIKVAHIALSFELGGAEKLLVEFARHADRMRFEPSFFALTRDGVIGDQLRSTGCDVTVLNGPEGVRPRLVYRLAKLLRQQRFDVVHTHLDRPHIYGTLAARLARIPCVVHTRHGQSDDLSSRQRWLVRALARWTDQFVCVSRDAAEIAVSEHGIPPERLNTIWNGIDLTRFQERSFQPAGPIVTVARLDPAKDIGNLLRATAIAAEHDSQLQVEIAGDGPSRECLWKLSHELGISDRVRFLGAIDDVPSLLTRASMFVLPSRTEGIALALLEAQAQGLPVVATRVGGNVEVIDDGRNGLLVPPSDPQQLARAILRMRTDSELAKTLGRAGRLCVEQKFDVTAMVDDYQALYDEFLSGRRG